ncbi:MAG: SEC-C domain-containing protein [Acidobacteria bacterium]|nr:SEC-C domain-containing protein [Acidobacteriota bacterium]
MISWVAIDRISEKQKASDAEYREKMADRPMRSSTKYLSDGELLAKLRSFGIELDRSSLEGLCNESLSAQEIAKPLIAKCAFKTTREEMEGDWIWICVEALWRRWFPDEPSFEMLDDKMEEGYEFKNSGQAEAACRVWLEAWDDAIKLFDKAGFKTIREFDDRFRGTYFLFNWVQSLEMQLWNAGLRDRRFLARRIEVCEERLRRFNAEDDPLSENCRLTLAESYFELGETGKADDLYREWLGADPRWGYGWVAWAECYWRTRTEFGALRRAEEILREGFSIAGVRNLADIADRLADLYKEQGRNDEANEIRRQAESMKAPPKPANLIAFTEAPVSGSRRKVGRNDTCPCGSGQKFKKCCAES